LKKEILVHSKRGDTVDFKLKYFMFGYIYTNLNSKGCTYS
jgi:hypothetical protein